LKEKDPVVSMFIPKQKEEKTISKVIQNLKNSSYYKTEIIVVDGHSNYGTEEILNDEKFCFVKIMDSNDTYETCARDRKSSEFFYWNNPK
jgi:glycosyltransferase involved in cell wall biosynthesis